ncbi:hypothetical protein MMC30_003604 [Trapelia coarctata]|nr:hypothetical protein [Trapelia coarctata]
MTKKEALKKCTIAVTGDFGKEKTYEKIKHWIEFQGGSMATKVEVKVTHLVCSHEHFKKNVTMVKQAKKIKTCKIVSYDWLEDSLMNFTPKRPGPYLLKSVIKERAKAKAKKKETRAENITKGVKNFEKGCDEFKTMMLTDGYHIYRDPNTGLGYDITLARVDLTTNTNERYTLKVPHPILAPLYPYHPPAPHNLRVPLPRPRTQSVQLYETHAAPFRYAVFVQYSSPTRGTAKQVLAPLGSSFELAMSSWEHFFRVKCKREWSERNGILEESESDEGRWVYKGGEEEKAAGEVVETVEPGW